MAGTVLVVDDDLDLREALEHFLKLDGYRVLTAANGIEALERLRQPPKPCLILLDLRMPVMNGWELRARLLADEALAALPVVLLSGAGDLATECVALSAADYVKKPFEPDDLLDRVRRFCG